MTDWRTDDGQVRAVLHAKDEQPTEETKAQRYERLLRLELQGYVQSNNSTELEEARDAAREERRQARGDTQAAWAVDNGA
jgi:hypothetical protein